MGIKNKLTAFFTNKIVVLSGYFTVFAAIYILMLLNVWKGWKVGLIVIVCFLIVCFIGIYFIETHWLGEKSEHSNS